MAHRSVLSAGAGAGLDAHNNAAALSGLRSQAFDGDGHNQLLFDDTPSQLAVQAGSTLVRILKRRGGGLPAPVALDLHNTLLRRPGMAQRGGFEQANSNAYGVYETYESHVSTSAFDVH